MKDERGQTIVEYILLLTVVIAIVVFSTPYIHAVLWGPQDKGAAVLKKARDDMGDDHFKPGDQW